LSACENVSQILLWLTILIAFFGMAVNAIVVWLLGFHIHRTPFSVYILNLAIQFQGWQNLKLILQRALQDTPEEDQCVDPPSQQALQIIPGIEKRKSNPNSP
uniref:Uncharacterized protein n=1 Tax=Spermophilus dauricus TaxID=99837 RepID=A0A8C9PLM5_SPEDA